jgi:hypothetical protein
LGLNVLSWVAWAQFPLIRALSTNIGNQGIRLASVIPLISARRRNLDRAELHTRNR